MLQNEIATDNVYLHSFSKRCIAAISVHARLFDRHLLTVLTSCRQSRLCSAALMHAVLIILPEAAKSSSVSALLTQRVLDDAPMLLAEQKLAAVYLTVSSCQYPQSICIAMRKVAFIPAK